MMHKFKLVTLRFLQFREQIFPVTAIRPASVLLLLFTGSYVFLLTWHAAFGIIDDHLFFNRDLWKNGIYLPIDLESGRFLPLNGLEYSLLKCFGIVSAPLYYGIQGLLLCVSVLLLRWCLTRQGFRNAACLWFSLVIFLSPPFIATIFRLFLAEVHLFILGLLLGIVLPEDEKDVTFSSMLLVFLLSNAMLYYKECMVVALFVISAVGIYVYWRMQERKMTYCYVLILGSCVLYLSIYYFFIYLKQTPAGYFHGRQIPLGRTVLYYLENDYLFLSFLLLTMAWRIRQWRRGARSPHPRDFLFLGGVALTIFYFILRFPAIYFLVPGYALALPLCIAFIRYFMSLKLSFGYRASIVIVVLLLSAVSIYSGLSRLITIRSVNNNYDAFLSELKTIKQGTSSSILLVLPGLTMQDEAAHSLWIRLLDSIGGYEFAFPRLDDLPAYLLALPKDRRVLIALTPYSRRNFAVDDWLALATPKIFTTRTLVQLPQFSLGELFRRLLAFQRDSPDSRGGRIVESTDFFLFDHGLGMTADILPFDMSLLVLSRPIMASVQGEITKLTMDITNTADRTFHSSLHDHSGDIRLIAFTVSADNRPRYAGEASCPETLSPGQTGEVSLPVSVARLPGSAVLAVALGWTRDGEIYFANDRLDIVVQIPGKTSVAN